MEALAKHNTKFLTFFRANLHYLTQLNFEREGEHATQLNTINTQLIKILKGEKETEKVIGLVLSIYLSLTTLNRHSNQSKRQPQGLVKRCL